MTDRKPPEPAVLAGLYGIEFTPYELTLLAGDGSGLDPYERQHRFLLSLALHGTACPVCGYLICQRSAAGMTLFTVPATVRPDDGYACPVCHTALTWHLALFGGDQWFTVTHPDALVLADARDLCAVDLGTGAHYADHNGSMLFPRTVAQRHADDLNADPAYAKTPAFVVPAADLELTGSSREGAWVRKTLAGDGHVVTATPAGNLTRGTEYAIRYRLAAAGPATLAARAGFLGADADGNLMFAAENGTRLVHASALIHATEVDRRPSERYFDAAPRAKGRRPR